MCVCLKIQWLQIPCVRAASDKPECVIPASSSVMTRERKILRRSRIERLKWSFSLQMKRCKASKQEVTLQRTDDGPRGDAVCPGV
jgi:hypothetical protein